MALNVPVDVVVLGRQRAASLEYFGVVACAVDDDAVDALFHHVLDQPPLEEVGLLGCLVEREDYGLFKEGRSKDIMADNSATEALPEQSSYCAFAGAGGTGHLDNEFA